MILADDLGYNELGCYGQEIIETPNIDKLAAQGLIFEDFYSGSPVCAPSRCALLTGKHPGHMYIRNNDEWDKRGNVWGFEACNENPYLEGQRPMSDTIQTIGKMLQDQGYETALIGKWGLGGPESQSTPNDQGFDFFFGYNCQRQAHTYYPVHLWKNKQKVLLQNKSVAPHQKLKESDDPHHEDSYKDFYQEDYAPALMLDEALGFMENNQTQPFFMLYASPIPHVALQAPKEWVDYYHQKFGEETPYTGDKSYFPCQYPHATYAAMISYLDWQLGEMVTKLKALGLYENTLIVFTSDNGPTYNGGVDAAYFNSAFPFSSEKGRTKGSLYEGGIRVPMIASWPGITPQGSQSNLQGSFWDFLPTFAEITKTETHYESDGISMLSTLTGDSQNQKKHDFLYWEFNSQQALVFGKWKAIRTEAKNPQSELLLFNLENDPGETKNVAAENPIIIEQIKVMMNNSHQPPTEDWQQKWVLSQAE